MRFSPFAESIPENNAELLPENMAVNGPGPGPDRLEKIMFVSFAALLVAPLLSICRSLDNNALTSWNWILPGTDAGTLYLFIMLGIALSYALSRSGILEHAPEIILPILAFVAVLPLWREPEVILDAGRYVLQAKHLELYGISSFLREWGVGVSAWTDLPVVPFLFGLIFRFLGESRLYIQAFTSLLFALTALLTYRIGRDLWGRDIGVAAGMLLLGSPYLLTQVPLMLVDVPTMFFLALSVHLFLSALGRGGVFRILSASVALFLTLFSKYSVLLILPVFLIIPFVRARSGAGPAAARGAAILACAGLLCAAALLLKYNIIMDQVQILRTFQRQGLTRWQEGIASTFLFQTHPFITLGACGGVAAAIRNRDARFLIPGWFAFFVVFLHHERIRYLLPLFPLFTLMAGYGLQSVRDRGVRSFILWCAVTSSLVIAVGAYVPFLERMSMANLRNAGRYLDTLESPAVEVFVLPQTRSDGNTEMAIPLLDLYTNKRIIYHERKQEASGLGLQGRMQSSLRFSWEIRLPEFYTGHEAAACLPAVLISSMPDTAAHPNALYPDAGMKALKRFESTTGVFKYKTFVSVYNRDCLAETGQ